MRYSNVSSAPSARTEMMHLPMSMSSGITEHGVFYTDTVSGLQEPKLHKHQSIEHNASPMIPASVIAAIFHIELHPHLTPEEIKQKFHATGYEYADALAKYYIDKFSQEQKAG
ncbi:MAG: hypothetical protein EAZ74_04575 [Alphaproteobacteria bacterium]|nr:MAG: hypothetical protein EAY76_06120 [Alphaproteobacteria bacterium]TAF14177.1 MAG: hypothetical protein EAZ74_04575 [Alphaproteobacteria bacterium]TAF39160.1 MAG: hypothetical protein EAZ66_05205 [Alphaproteobacteria bacterium]TAF74953.1 MAG: hypothetical protein EAZ52_07840 [Alphaproteobacteria bacterium]